ncbi:hypothetical protein ACFYSC_30535 [Streptosporangium sp. NPDC004379]|uniref:hypothetical protein n=1 Tax=Streptosporangium sp. NPDC004379 TaxID=3366189 RepID=UPI00368EC4DF
MTGPWRSAAGGSVAAVAVMGLVLLSLLLSGSPGAWSAGKHAHPAAPSSGPVWGPGTWDDAPASLPPQAAGVREHHVPSLWPSRGERQEDAAHLALPSSPGPDTDAIRDPQQFAHRTAGSRSPPAGVSSI